MNGALDLGTTREVEASRRLGGAGRKLSWEGSVPPRLVGLSDGCRCDSCAVRSRGAAVLLVSLQA